jgi:hypothetical protein
MIPPFGEMDGARDVGGRELRFQHGDTAFRDAARRPGA